MGTNHIQNQFENLQLFQSIVDHKAYYSLKRVVIGQKEAIQDIYGVAMDVKPSTAEGAEIISKIRIRCEELAAKLEKTMEIIEKKYGK